MWCLWVVVAPMGGRVPALSPNDNQTHPKAHKKILEKIKFPNATGWPKNYIKLIKAPLPKPRSKKFYFLRKNAPSDALPSCPRVV